MKDQFRINKLGEGGWVRCSRAEVRNGNIEFCLKADAMYNLDGAYQKAPHLQLLKCKTDRDFANFTRSWGPLYLREEDTTRGSGSLPVAFYLGFQSWLKRAFELIGAFKAAEGERSAVIKYVESLSGLWESSPRFGPGIEPVVLRGMRYKFGAQGNLLVWIEDLPTSGIIEVEKYLLGLIGFEIHHLRLFAERVGRRRSVDARYVIANLEEALEWMVWFGEFNRHPVVCCSECHTFFRGESAHTRKFCSVACARRQTSRNWNRKKRAEGGKNGTHKAR